MAAVKFRRGLLLTVISATVACAQGNIYRVPTGAMEPTLLTGDRIFVTAASKYRRGDIIVFSVPVLGENAKQIKRLIGLPGDHLKLSDKVLTLNSHAVNEIYVMYVAPKDRLRDFYYLRNFPPGAEKRTAPGFFSAAGREMLQKYVHDGELFVPDGQYFVLGDNRDVSLDSRLQGLVPASMIIGVVQEIVSSDDPDTKRPRSGRAGIPIARGSLQ